MRTEAKRIATELKMLSEHGVHISRELVMSIASHDTYWYVVFANTRNFDDSMNELMAEAA